MVRPHHVTPILAGLAALALLGCSQSDFGTVVPDVPDPPKTDTPYAEDISCDSNDDCDLGEECIDGICQFSRCTDGPYDSLAPIGDRFVFFSDREVLVADETSASGSYYLDTYLPGSDALSYPDGGDASFNLGQNQVVDVAAGNVLGEAVEQSIVAIEGLDGVRIGSGDDAITLSLPYQPVAVAAGDTDHDSIDNVIALGPAGKFAVCSAVDKSCVEWGFPGEVESIDVSVGDVDGDGYGEPVFLLKVSGNHQIVAFNLDYEATGEKGVIAGGVDSHTSLDVADLDGDGIAEVIALRDRGSTLGVKRQDHINVHSFALGELTQLGGPNTVDHDTRDIAASDLDGDGRAEVLLLRDTRTVEHFALSAGGEPGLLVSSYTTDLSDTDKPRRIATMDYDGDSPVATRIGDRELVAGRIVPTMVVNFPPYSRQYSDGLPTVMVGESSSVGQALTDSVSLRASVEIGVEAGIDGLFKASLSTRVSKTISSDRRSDSTLTIGSRYVIRPDEDAHGSEYAAVVLSSVCYHAYRYELEDPAGVLDQAADGAFVVMVPVAGQTTVWSSKRYNALAKALGNLPIIESSGRLGDVSSYPSAPMLPDGTPVPQADRVFPDVPTLVVSDVGDVGWWLSVNESETNAVSLSSELAVSGSFNAFGVKVGSSIAVGQSSSLALSVGEAALFGGSVPPIRDNETTPEDEYAAHRYSFAPSVHRQHYVDNDGNDGAFYVLSFTAGANE